jgi:hypothetical protein
MGVARAGQAVPKQPPAAELAALARTVIAGGHGGLLAVGGGALQPVGYVDDDGEPVLVLPGIAPTPRGSACLYVAAGPGRRVVLAGRLRPVRDEHAVADLVGGHAACFAQVLAADPVQLVRFAVEAVRVDAEGAGVEVSSTAFAVAEPDLWEALGGAVSAHLSEAHGDVLARIARRFVAGDEVVAAAVRRLSRTAIELDVITASGAGRVTVPLSPAVNDPHRVCRRLAELALPKEAGLG